MKLKINIRIYSNELYPMLQTVKLIMAGFYNEY